MRLPQAVVLLILLAGCTGAVSSPRASGTPPAPASPSPSPAGLLPLGDGRVSSGPQAGYTWSCQTVFNGRGAQVAGPWIMGASWDPGRKLQVQGDVSWPQARYAVSVSGGRRSIGIEGVPVGESTGIFPISSSDPAYQYDANPNRIAAQSATINVDANPAPAAQPSCLGLGPVGVLDDGVLLFDALDGQGRDAVAHEVLDRCDGHPAPGGTYHHHKVPSCLLAKASGPSTLVGYAFDGYGIYGERDSAGRLLTDSDLDACHGRVSSVVWDGRSVTMYHYDATAAFPYVIGCYHGTPETRPGGPPPG